jgi:Tol biopolymer transport system component
MSTTGNLRISASLVVFTFSLLLASCQTNFPAISVDDDIFALAFKGESLTCKSFFYTTSSSAGGEIHHGDLDVLGDYAEWSPDGRWLLSIQNGFTQLYIVRSSLGESFIEVLSPDGMLFDASWAPDSERIAYSVSTPNGSEMRQTDVSCLQIGESCNPQERIIHYGRSLDWSPDGKMIAFEWDNGIKSTSPRNNVIYIMNVDSEGPPMRISGALENCRNPDWSPDGSKLVFACQWDIYISDADGGGLTNLTGGLTDPEDSDPWWPADKYPKWVPGGERIAFISDRIPNSHYVGSCEDFVSNAIYTIDSDGSNIERVTSVEDISTYWYQWIIRP